MAQQTTAADRTDTTTVSIQVRYTLGPYAKDVDGPEQGTEEFVVSRDLRGHGTDAFFDLGHDPEHAVSIGTDEIADVELEADPDATPIDVAAEVYDRMQGPRVDDELGYDGSRMRSMTVGDIVVVDDIPVMVDRIGFEAFVDMEAL